MASPYIVNIVNGVGTKALLNGDYTISTAVTGYDNASVLPASQTVSAGVNSYSFTLASTGTLTLHVTEDGAAGGTPVAGASFARCDSLGNTYGSPITTDVNGDAGAPLSYYNQLNSDGEHEFNPALVSTSMTTSAETVEVTNAPPASRTIYLTDLNYLGLPIETGTLTLA